MSDLIDRQAARSFAAGSGLIRHMEDGDWIRVEEVRENIDMLPSSDAVQVVQCKDCKWYDNRYGDVCHNPRYGDGWANYSPPYVDEDYWCKDGERKGGEDE